MDSPLDGKVTELRTKKQHTNTLCDASLSPLMDLCHHAANHHPGMSLVYSRGTGSSPDSQAAPCGVKCGDILKVVRCALRVSLARRGFTNVAVYSQNVVTRRSLLGFQKHALVHTPVRPHAVFFPHAPTIPLAKEIDGVDVLNSKVKVSVRIRSRSI